MSYSLYTGYAYYTYIYSRRLIQITGVSCFGNEYRLTDCDYSINELGECQYDDIGVTCSTGTYTSFTLQTLWNPLCLLIFSCISCHMMIYKEKEDGELACSLYKLWHCSGLSALEV